MHTHSTKINNAKSNAIANVASKVNNTISSPLQFVDNRPESIKQKRTIERLNGFYSNTVQTTDKSIPKTFLENREQTVQMKSDRKYGGLHYGSGTLADYFIDPQDPLIGKSPPSSRPPWWDNLKAATGSFPESNLVQGHLVNHHVGGEDDMQNLTPITRSANTTMLNFFENDVKNEYTKAKNIAATPVIHYKVDASGYGNIKDIGVLGGSKALQSKIAPYLPGFAEWIGAEYDIYPRVKGDRSDLNGAPIFSLPQKKWVKNENKDEKGNF